MKVNAQEVHSGLAHDELVDVPVILENLVFDDDESEANPGTGDPSI